MSLEVLIVLMMVLGLFIIFNINPLNTIKRLIKWRPKKKEKIYTVKSFMETVNGKERRNFVQKSISETKKSLVIIGQGDRYKNTLRLSMGIGLLGALMGMLLFHNILLVLVLGVGCYLLPLWLTKLAVYSHTIHVNDQLETTLSMITVTYSRTKNLVSAVEEALPHANFPVKEVLLQFLSTIHNIDFDVTKGVIQMKEDLDNIMFRQWCDVLILCQEDSALIAGLQPIVRKISHIKQQQEENETLMMMPLRQMIMMILIVCASVPLLHLINPEWYAYLVNTIAGQIIMAVLAIVIFASINKSINLSRPIDYTI